MISNETRKAIEEVVARQLSPATVVSIDILEDVDQDGEPILRVDVVFDAKEKKLNPARVIGLGRHLREPFEKLREARFPVFYFATPDDLNGAAA